MVKGIEVVTPPCVPAVAAEKAAIAPSLKGHAKVITLRVQRVTRVVERVAARLRIHRGHVYVQPAHAFMAIAGEVEVAIGTESGKHLVPWGIDGLPKVLRAAQPRGSEPCPPQVEPSLPARHVGDEIQPLAIGRDGGVGVTGERVDANLQRGGLAPSGV